MDLSWILFLGFAALGAWFMMRGVTLNATITRIENGKFILCEGLFWKQERVLDLSSCRWGQTQTIRGTYTSLLLPSDMAPKHFSILPGAVSYEAIKALVESIDINWFNEETYHGGGQDQFHCSVKHPMRLDEWLAILTSR